MSRHLPLVIVVAIAFAGAAHAGNLIQNPDFSQGLQGWTQIYGSGDVTIDDSIGILQPPSLHIVVASFGINVESACMVVDNHTNMDLRINAGGGPGAFLLTVEPFSDTQCAVALEVTHLPGSPLGLYSGYGWPNLPLPGGTHSAKVVIGLSSYNFGDVPNGHFDHVGFGPTGTLGSSFSIQEGLSGAWYNPETSGQGLEFIVSPDRFFAADSAVFGAWYTYDTTAGGADSQRWYSFQTGMIEPGNASTPVTIYQNVGGNFDAPPITSSVAIGTGVLLFDTCSSGAFSYVLDDGRTGTMPLRRLLPNVSCIEGNTPTNPPSDFGLSGSWYNASTSGQGFMISVDPVDAQVFVGWFTYALSGELQGASGQRWFSAQGGYTVGSTAMDLTLYASTGGSFDSDDSAVTTAPVGTATLTYSSCTEATFDYAFTSGELSGRSDTIALTRLDAPLASCDVSN